MVAAHWWIRHHRRNDKPFLQNGSSTIEIENRKEHRNLHLKYKKKAHYLGISRVDNVKNGMADRYYIREKHPGELLTNSQHQFQGYFHDHLSRFNNTFYKGNQQPDDSLSLAYMMENCTFHKPWHGEVARCLWKHILQILQDLPWTQFHKPACSGHILSYRSLDLRAPTVELN